MSSCVRVNITPPSRCRAALSTSRIMEQIVFRRGNVANAAVASPCAARARRHPRPPRAARDSCRRTIWQRRARAPCPLRVCALDRATGAARREQRRRRWRGVSPKAPQRCGNAPRVFQYLVRARRVNSVLRANRPKSIGNHGSVFRCHYILWNRSLAAVCGLSLSAARIMSARKR